MAVKGNADQGEKGTGPKGQRSRQMAESALCAFLWE